MQWSSVESVFRVHHQRGARTSSETEPDVLVEVPHAADRRAHFDAVASRLQGALPDRLHEFFHLNTDVGAWALSEAIAAHWVELRPTSHVVLIECLLPRTFADCNRRMDFDGDHAGMTSAIPVYITHDADRRLLTELHARYVDFVEAAYAQVCDRGGLALNPHTFGPRSLPIQGVDANIVDELRRVHEPEIYATAPLRPHLDVIGRDRDGRRYTPESMIEAVAEAVRPLGIETRDSVTYQLHPVTQGWRLSTRHPGQVFGFEVRRDLVCAWSPFVEQEIDKPRIDALARAIAEGIHDAWQGASPKQRG